jgi:hypothetical protein
VGTEGGRISRPHRRSAGGNTSSHKTTARQVDPLFFLFLFEDNIIGQLFGYGIFLISFLAGAGALFFIYRQWHLFIVLIGKYRFFLIL